MRKSSAADKPCALLWDESYLWGLMAFNALKAAGLPFDLVRSEDVKKGGLRNYRMILVPGGWASNKIKSLGNEGVQEIIKFVGEGGSYLGLCGGAGLATLDGIGLVNVKRVPTRERVPSFSGRASFEISGHPMWAGLSEDKPSFSVWWPSQFSTGSGVNILAAYREALSDAFSSDLNVGDVRRLVGKWHEFEESYGINLDPGRLTNQPAVVEGDFGKGKVLLSLIHFDTPDGYKGATVLRNLFMYLSGAGALPSGGPERSTLSDIPGKLIQTMELAEDLIDFGQRNFLWFWRNPMLLQWRRGVRGLEYCTLYVMIKAAAETARKISSDEIPLEDKADEINRLLLPFKEKAERLLLLERNALQEGHRITYEKGDDPEMMHLRSELFSNSKSYGGMFKKLLDNIDELLYGMLWLI